MKKQIFNFFRSLAKSSQSLAPQVFQPVQLAQRDIGLILISGLTWLALVQSRSFLIKPSCLDVAHPCQKQSVFFVDQISLGIDVDPADLYSFFTQNLSIVLALTLPLLWNTYRGLTSRGLTLRSAREICADLSVAIQAIFWNGVFTEVSHAIAQRPRPFVYSDPLVLGIDPAHYTSFYSGHTSGAAAANTVAFLLLLSRNAPVWLLVLDLGITETLIFSTGYFRIMSARHFLTDVLCGAIAGILTALLVFAMHPKARQTSRSA